MKAASRATNNSAEGAPRAPSSARSSARGILTAAVVIWALTAAYLLVGYWTDILALRTIDPDDALRLVQVRDLVGGQHWWDLTQYRVNPAGSGIAMHWSRLVDAPIAGLISLLSPTIGTGAAERVTVAVVPLLLLGVTFVGAGFAYRCLGNTRLAIVALIMIATDVVILFQFGPVRIDHHGWQIMLATVMLLAALGPAGRRSGLLCGAAGAVALSISLEQLPLVATFGAIFAVRWIVDPTSAARRHLVAYVGALAAAALLVQFGTRGPGGITDIWCDALSLPYLVALSVAAVALPIATTVADHVPRSVLVRTGLLALCGAVSAPLILLVAPGCASGPFGQLDPIVMEYWYYKIDEGQPFWFADTAAATYMMVPILVGLVGTWLAWRSSAEGEVRTRWLTLLAASLGAAIVAVFVLRGASVAHVFVLPGSAWIALKLWDKARRIARPLPRILASVFASVAAPLVAGNVALLLIAVAFPATGILQNSFGKADTAKEDDTDCLVPRDAALLGRLPPATVLVPLDLGPDVLEATHHSVLATGHHRNNALMALTLEIFTGSTASARERIHASGATMIVLCPTAADLEIYADVPNSFAGDLIDGPVPRWLSAMPMSPGSPLTVWRVAPYPNEQ